MQEQKTKPPCVRCQKVRKAGTALRKAPKNLYHHFKRDKK